MRRLASVAFDGYPASEKDRRVVTDQVQELADSCRLIRSCRVLVGQAERRSQGPAPSVRIDLCVPGGEIVVNPDRGAQFARAGLAEAVRTSVNAARRQLNDYARVLARSGRDAPSDSGRIIRIMPEQDRGVIATRDGRRYEFRRSEANAFDTLSVGESVQFVDGSTDGTWAAISVRRASGRGPGGEQ